MKFIEFVQAFGRLPLIETENLLAGAADSAAIKVQLSRWTRSGKIIQLKRGVYLLAESYRRVEPYEPFIASILKKPSYLSLEKALEHHHLIPESVPVYTSVTPKGPARFISELGSFNYRHIQPSLFWGYESVTVRRQTAFIATPEKALLDLIYLKAGEISGDYLEEMRLENLQALRPTRVLAHAARFNMPRMARAARVLTAFIRSRRREEKTL